MDQELKGMVSALEDSANKALIVGNEVLFPPWELGGKVFHFNAVQTRFLYALQTNGGDVEKAALCCGKEVAWAQRFLASRKFKDFRNAKLASMSVRNGDLVEEWWKYGRDGMKGSREHYESVCHMCHEKNEYSVPEVEMTRNDDMKLNVSCKVCLQPVVPELKIEIFKPSREQVQFWSELGNRLSPKIERVQHQFSSENFSFVTGDAA
jgi:hypothetical protein